MDNSKVTALVALTQPCFRQQVGVGNETLLPARGLVALNVSAMY